MNQRARNTIMLAASGYIVYTGAMLIKNAIEEDVTSNMIFIIIGAIFTIFGIITFISYGKALLKEMKAEANQTDELDTTDTISGEENEETNS